MYIQVGSYFMYIIIVCLPFLLSPLPPVLQKNKQTNEQIHVYLMCLKFSLFFLLGGGLQFYYSVSVTPNTS